MNEEKVVKALTGLNFSKALEFMKMGLEVTREGWNGKGMWLEIQHPDEHSKMTRPYVFMTIPAGATNQFGEQGRWENQRVPWLCSQTDLLAEDWEVVLGPPAGVKGASL